MVSSSVWSCPPPPPAPAGCLLPGCPYTGGSNPRESLLPETVTSPPSPSHRPFLTSPEVRPQPSPPCTPCCPLPSGDQLPPLHLLSREAGPQAAMTEVCLSVRAPCLCAMLAPRFCVALARSVLRKDRCGGDDAPKLLVSHQGIQHRKHSTPPSFCPRAPSSHLSPAPHVTGLMSLSVGSVGVWAVGSLTTRTPLGHSVRMSQQEEPQGPARWKRPRKRTFVCAPAPHIHAPTS